MASYVESAWIVVALWAFGGIFTVAGALSFAELAAMAPKAGGQYVYLQEAFGRFWGFLYGWTLCLVIQTGFNAAVAIAFAKYLGVFVPALGENQILLTWLGISLNSAQLVACGILVLLTWVNILGVREGALVQNVFTVLKIGAIAILAIAGLWVSRTGFSSWGTPLPITLGPNALEIGLAAALAVALSKALFAYDAWNTATFVAEEVRDAERALPRALLWGCLGTAAIYVGINLSYFVTMPAAEIATLPEARVGQYAAMRVFGDAGQLLIVAAILVSTFGCVNGMILGGARVCFAMARDGLFLRACATLDPQRDTPKNALLFQCFWSCLLALSGSYSALLTYTTFASVLFGALTVVGLFRLRSIAPERPRPYRCWAYPFTPMVYLAIALPFLIYVIQGDPVSTGWGILIVASGVPFYWNIERKKA
jgi:APA family basic amino acid/polyamine antiporter